MMKANVAPRRCLFELRRVEGLRIKVVRLFNTYGPRMRADDGRAISNFVAQALSGVPITIHGSGQQSRSWGYVSDIVEALERYFWRDDVTYQGPVNIGSDREVSVRACRGLRRGPGCRHDDRISAAGAPRPDQPVP